jgi:hypothetical protein
MLNYVALSKTAHADKAFLKSSTYRHAAGDMFIPLLLEELPHVLPTITMTFRKHPDHQDTFEIGALLSVIPGKNLYVAPNGRWIGGYIPAAYRGYPFAILSEAGTGKPALHYNQDSGLQVEKGDPDAQPFFADDGQLTPFMKNVLNFLEQCQRGKHITQIAVNALVQNQLLIPWEIKIIKADTQSPIEAELYRIDEPALQKLDAAVLHALSASNALYVAYAQIFSQHRLSGLAKLYQLQEKLDKNTTDIPDIDKLFGDDHDPFKFY